MPTGRSAGTPATIVTCAEAPDAIVPSAQETVPPASEQAPWLGVADTKVRPGGSGSSSVTPVAADGPPLETTSVQVTVPPAIAVPPVFSRVRSAAGPTVVLAESLSFELSVSAWSPDTTAVLVRVCSASANGTATTRSNVSLAPVARSPTSQVTISPAAEHSPAGSEETRLVPAGSVSTARTPVASEGPLLVTVSE